MEHRALGKGLSALIPDRPSVSSEAAASGSAITRIKTAQIKDNAQQPRLNYDDAKLSELVSSIRENGILQPILVRKKDDGYEVIAGERRLKAARVLKLDEVPVVIHEVGHQEALVLALVENIQREELNAIEEAKAFRRLVGEFGLSHDDLAKAVSRDRSTISNTLRLLKLSEDIQAAVTDGRISMGHARALLGTDDDGIRKDLFARILEGGLSVRETENLVKAGQKTQRRKKGRDAQRNTDLVFIEEDLQQVLGTRVKILAQKKRGKIIVEFYSPDDLERILRVIKSS